MGYSDEFWLDEFVVVVVDCYELWVGMVFVGEGECRGIDGLVCFESSFVKGIGLNCWFFGNVILCIC